MTPPFRVEPTYLTTLRGWECQDGHPTTGDRNHDCSIFGDLRNHSRAQQPWWLVDKPALARLTQQVVYEAAWPRVVEGRIGVSICTELEMGFSTRSTADYPKHRRSLLTSSRVPLPYGSEARAW